MDANANAAHEKHHAIHTGPIERVNMAGNEGVDEERRAKDKDIERYENADESATEHELEESFPKHGRECKRSFNDSWQ